MIHTAWKGKISFGLIDVPIKLHGVTEDKEIKLRTLHKKCYTPIKHERRCPKCEEEVGTDEIIKGYETVSGQFVPVADEELEILKRQFNEDKDVNILHFVNPAEIDPVFFDKSYYISPLDTGKKAYYVLRKALLQTAKAGIAKVFLYSKQQLALIRPFDKGLVLDTLHYQEEIRPISEVPNIHTQSDISDQDVSLTSQLIEKLSTPFQPETYENEYKHSFQELLEHKIAKGEFVSSPHIEDNKEISRLMEMLKFSIDQTGISRTNKPASPLKIQVK